MTSNNVQIKIILQHLACLESVGPTFGGLDRSINTAGSARAVRMRCAKLSNTDITINGANIANM